MLDVGVAVGREAQLFSGFDYMEAVSGFKRSQNRLHK